MEQQNTIPCIIEQTNSSERTYDIYSRLLKDRIVFLNEEVNSKTAGAIIAQLLFLQSQSKTEDIVFYINSPGGSVSDGLAIYDTIKYIKCDVQTVVLGTAASMAAVLAASGTKGKRYALPHSRLMIHQPSNYGISGKATDVKIITEQLLEYKRISIEILSKNTGQPFEKLEQDMERDKYMNAEKALEYGLIDKIIPTKD